MLCAYPILKLNCHSLCKINTNNLESRPYRLGPEQILLVADSSFIARPSKLFCPKCGASFTVDQDFGGKVYCHVCGILMGRIRNV